MKAIPHFLVAGVLVLGTACSTTNTGTGSGEPTSSSVTTTPTGSDTNASSTTTGSAGAADGGSTAGAGGTSGAGTDTGTGASAATSGTTGDAGDGAPSANMTAFMGTFATMPDAVFLMTAASSNLLEIQVGQMAAQQATSPEVKNFAQMMVADHTKATQQLQAVATPLQVQLPQTMMPIHQAMADRLQNKTGRKYDEAYMSLMKTAHRLDIDMFKVKDKAAQTAAVQTFAANTLPMLHSHRNMASALDKQVK